MEHLKQILIFNTVLQHGSMNAAAQALGISTSAVSQHIRKLEQHYRVKLLNRTTRSLVPTEEGRILHQYARQLADWQEASERAMGNLQAEPAGEVRISLPTGYSGTTALKNTVQTLHRRHPKIRLVLLESNRLADLHNDDADIAVRAITRPDDPDTIARPLAVWQTRLCAAPDYLQRHPINAPQDLPQAHWLNHSDAVLLHTFRHLGLPETLPAQRTDCPNVSLAARELARAGMGVAILLSGDADPLIRDGSLVAVLPQYPLPERTLYAVTAHRAQSAKVRAVLAALTESFGGSEDAE